MLRIILKRSKLHFLQKKKKQFNSWEKSELFDQFQACVMNIFENDKAAFKS